MLLLLLLLLLFFFYLFCVFLGKNLHARVIPPLALLLFLSLRVFLSSSSSLLFSSFLSFIIRQPFMYVRPRPSSPFSLPPSLPTIYSLSHTQFIFLPLSPPLLPKKTPHSLFFTTSHTQPPPHPLPPSPP